MNTEFLATMELQRATPFSNLRNALNLLLKQDICFAMSKHEIIKTLFIFKIDGNANADATQAEIKIKARSNWKKLLVKKQLKFIEPIDGNKIEYRSSGFLRRPQKFGAIFFLVLTLVGTKLLQIFVAFLENLNFNKLIPF